LGGLKFIKDLDSVEALARDLKISYGEVSGRRKDLDRGRMPAGIDLMGVQVQSGGIGIDLTRASDAFWYSTGFSLGDYEQACARLHRPGQKRVVRHYHLICKNTVDETVHRAIASKANIVSKILEKLKNAGEKTTG